MTRLNNTESSFEEAGISVDQRKMNAVRAYFEWMPIRQVDMDDVSYPRKRYIYETNMGGRIYASGEASSLVVSLI